MGKKYIIFDFDGTLVHTNDVIIGSWQATYEHYLGRQVSRSQIEQTFGETLADTIRNRIPGAPVEEVKSYYRAWQEAHKGELVYIYDGIRDLLAELRERGCVIGVGTSRTASSLWNYLRQFGIVDYIDAVVTMDDVTRHKPHPDTALAVLAKMAGLEDSSKNAGNAGFKADAENMSLKPGAGWTGQEAGTRIPADVLADAVMLGDSRFDIGCASNAGIDSVLTIWGRPIGEEEIATWDWRPTYIIERPEELLKIVR